MLSSPGREKGAVETYLNSLTHEFEVVDILQEASHERTYRQRKGNITYGNYVDVKDTLAATRSSFSSSLSSRWRDKYRIERTSQTNDNFRKFEIVAESELANIE